MGEGVNVTSWARIDTKLVQGYRDDLRFTINRLGTLAMLIFRLRGDLNDKRRTDSRSRFENIGGY